ncbi:hypothetical protein [Cohaesibacter celericrescens]|uniref:hypothetical protein n=1 Tax=Cohaesibacter celericrescens TaxID=2067669 RepID=UPI00356418E4
MIRLNKTRLDLKEGSKDLGRGVSLIMRPVSAVEHAAAKERASDMVSHFLDGSGALSLVGLPEISVGNGSNEDHRYMLNGLSRILIAVYVAEMVVSGWEGVGDEDGKPIDPSLSAFGMLFQDTGFLANFESHAYVSIFLEAREGEQ